MKTWTIPGSTMFLSNFERQKKKRERREEKRREGKATTWRGQVYVLFARCFSCEKTKRKEKEKQIRGKEFTFYNWLLSASFIGARSGPIARITIRFWWVGGAHLPELDHWTTLISPQLPARATILRKRVREREESNRVSSYAE